MPHVGTGDGYVLNFSNRTFSEFFAEELDVDIDQPRWSVDGTSKAKRLRTYLRKVDRETALRTLQALWVLIGAICRRLPFWHRLPVKNSSGDKGPITLISGRFHRCLTMPLVTPARQVRH